MIRDTFNNSVFGNFVKLQRGFDLPKQDRETGVFPVVASTSVQDYHAEYKVKPPGVVTGRSGSLGTVQYLQVPFWPLNTTLWVKDFKGNDPKFVFYFLQTLGLERYNSGAGVPTLNRNHLATIDVAIPPLPTQRKIAAILSAYDDLIENNLRRIKILEEMAQNLYREWFVNFRFPGHEKVRMVDSPLGKIPAGWEVRRLDELCSTVLDGDWIETKDQGGEDYRLLQISNIGLGDFVETGKFRYVTQETFDQLRCTEIRPDDFLIARMPTPVGRGWLARKMPWRMITAVDVAIARPDTSCISPVFLLYFWNQPSNLAAIEKQSSGTTRLRITRRELSAMLIPTPNLALQDQFSAKVKPMLIISNILRDKNTILRRTRDLLLPKLISGEVDVSELDINILQENNA
ncbi:MAG: restriction endonuclease subunit S [Dehalococcoidia bacterium]|nr:restriction endonuclease subunit S [Dehalococcoidia bacterium]